MNKKKVYLAGPLFSEAEQTWMRSIKEEIKEIANRKGVIVEVYWPYDDLDEKRIKSLREKAKMEIFEKCTSNLKDSDILIALLDGPQVDDGTAWEIGYFYKNKKKETKILGVRTDFRKAGETDASRVNAMVEVSCDKIVSSLQELKETVKDIL